MNYSSSDMSTGCQTRLMAIQLTSLCSISKVIRPRLQRSSSVSSCGCERHELVGRHEDGSRGIQRAGHPLLVEDLGQAGLAKSSNRPRKGVSEHSPVSLTQIVEWPCSIMGAFSSVRNLHCHIEAFVIHYSLIPP